LDVEKDARQRRLLPTSLATTVMKSMLVASVARWWWAFAVMGLSKSMGAAANLKEVGGTKSTCLDGNAWVPRELNGDAE
jgi:hypothetical protein